MRKIGRRAYNQPYPPQVNQVEFPVNYKVPNFSLFSGDGEQSTIEHVGRFTVQCGHAGGIEALKLRLFPNSFTGIALSGYNNLPANSVLDWQQMEGAFHAQFYRTEPETLMADLSRLHQLLGESVEVYIGQFRKAKYRC